MKRLNLAVITMVAVLCALNLLMHFSWFRDVCGFYPRPNTFHFTQEPVVAAAGGVRMQVIEAPFDPKGAYQELTLDTSTVQELTVPDGAELVWLQAAGNNIRYRMDDVDPTTSVGFQMFPGDYYLSHVIIRKMRFLSESGTATLRAQPLGQ